MHFANQGSKKVLIVNKNNLEVDENLRQYFKWIDVRSRKKTGCSNMENKGFKGLINGNMRDHLHTIRGEIS